MKIQSDVRIGKIAPDATQRFGEGTSQLGDSVALHAENGIDIVAVSHRTQTFSPDVFTNVGIDPTEKQILIVKSMQHFHAGFAPIAIGLGLTLIGLVAAQDPRPGFNWAGWTLLLGALIFCDTVAWLALGGPRWLGAVTPMGGVLMVVGFLLFAWTAWRL